MRFLPYQLRSRCGLVYERSIALRYLVNLVKRFRHFRHAGTLHVRCNRYFRDELVNLVNALENIRHALDCVINQSSATLDLCIRFINQRLNVIRGDR